MEPYVPKEVESEINTKRIDSTTDILILFFGSVVALVIFFFLSVFLVQSITTRLSPQLEEKYFSWIADDMVGRRVSNPELMAILGKLAKQQKLYNVKFSIACDAQLNAFALPGGRIVINQGLLKKMKTEEGLAFVVGHELGHLAQRHHLKGLGLGVVSVFVSMMFSADSTWIWSTLQGLLVSAHSRDKEEQADAYSLSLMEKIYGSPRGAEEFFLLAKEQIEEKIQNHLWFVSTHPVTNERISKITERASHFKSRDLRQTPLFVRVAEEACR